MSKDDNHNKENLLNLNNRVLNNYPSDSIKKDNKNFINNSKNDN